MGEDFRHCKLFDSKQLVLHHTGFVSTLLSLFLNEKLYTKIRTRMCSRKSGSNRSVQS